MSSVHWVLFQPSRPPVTFAELVTSKLYVARSRLTGEIDSGQESGDAVN